MLPSHGVDNKQLLPLHGLGFPSTASSPVPWLRGGLKNMLVVAAPQLPSWGLLCLTLSASGSAIGLLTAESFESDTYFVC